MMGLRRFRAVGEARRSLDAQTRLDAPVVIPRATASLVSRCRDTGTVMPDNTDNDRPARSNRPRNHANPSNEPQTLTRHEADDTAARRQMRWLPIRLIQYGPRETRSAIDERKLDELAESIRALGLLQPITVRTAPGNRYELIAGERRLRACEKLGWDNIDAIVLPAGDVDRDMLALAENIQRVPLHYLEEAETIDAVRSETGLSLQEIAARLGTSTISLSNKLRLLKIPPETRRLIRDLDLNERYARVLLRLNEENMQQTAARRIVEKQLTLRDAESLVENMTIEGPTYHRCVTAIVRDHRPYVNAINDIVDQMRRSGLSPSVESAESDSRLVLTVSLPKIL
ncbi:MAG: ParB/RepB/Spo0J family partition protein [Oscillospiraceae bacterium]|nr:ParB/RepB/Spo0J family partition protein [Oscillospiraceae bacterium]